MKRTRPFSIWTLIVVVVVAGLSIGGWALVQNGVQRQDKALLQNDQSQVVLLLQSSLQNLQTELRSIAYFTVASHNSPDVFDQQTKAVLTQSTQSVALVDKSGSTPQVVLASGPDIQASQPLAPPLAAVAARATPTLSAEVVHVGTHTLLAVTATTPVFPNTVTLLTSVLTQNKPTPNRSGPYAHIYLNLYATPQARPDQLILTTFGAGPLPPPVAMSVLKLGSINWLVVAAQREPLAGTYAHATPWIVLGVGLLIALALASVIEALARRERHAARLVAERSTELLEVQKTLIRNERLAAVGELATVVGHELRNPLGAAINNLYLLRETLGDHVSSEALEFLTEVDRQVSRAATLSDDLTAYMRERDPVLGDIDFSTLVSDVLDSTPPPPGVDVSVERSVRFTADRSLMTQVMINLITNAYQAMPRGGAVHLAASDGDQTTTITVQDTGTGFDATVAGRLFDPFFSTKDEGTGLGLAIVQRLVALQSGAVTIENVDGGGARVLVRIPRHEPE